MVKQMQCDAHSKLRGCDINESATQISGWKEPFETDTKRTKNILSICMNPRPTFHRSSTGLSGVNFCVASVSDAQVEEAAMLTYGHIAEVPFEPLGNFMGKFGTFYWLTSCFPIPRMDLELRD